MANKKAVTKKKSVAKAQQSQPLTGKELLEKLKEIDHLSKTEKAKACGYENANGSKTRVNLSGFMNAILEAKGVSLEPESKRDGRGREASYRVTVHKNGQIVIGANYTEQMGLKAGDEFEVKVGYKKMHLKLATDNS